jgi:nicotinamidase-related amidase
VLDITLCYYYNVNNKQITCNKNNICYYQKDNKKEEINMNKNELQELRKIIYNIDMVNGFVREGALHDTSIEESIPEQERLLKKFNGEKQGIAFIKDNHKLGCAEFNRFPVHCVTGTTEAVLVDELLPYEKDAIVYLKNSTSAMFAPNMIRDLERMENLVEVVGTGCLTHICVPNFLIPLKNYFDQMNRDVKVFAVKKAIANLNTEARNYQDECAYYMMENNGIIVVENLEELEEKENSMGLGLKRKGF